MIHRPFAVVAAPIAAVRVAFFALLVAMAAWSGGCSGSSSEPSPDAAVNVDDQPLSNDAIAKLFTPQQHEAFLGKVADWFTDNDIEVSINNGVITDTEQREFGLLNLAQTCAQAPEDQWRDIIDGHFTAVTKTFEGPEAHGIDLTDFAAVRDRLTLRLYPDEYFERVDTGKLITRRDLEGIRTTLCLDMPDTVMMIRIEDAVNWDMSTAECFAIAQANVAKLAPIGEIMTIETPDGPSLKAVASESFYITGHLLTLDRVPELLGEHGAIVAVPTRHSIISLPIDAPSAIKSISPLIQATVTFAEAGPGTISSDIYWYHEGKFTRLPYTLEDRTISFHPPESFNEFLTGLIASHGSKPEAASDHAPTTQPQPSQE